jgi:hypothetical protein
MATRRPKAEITVTAHKRVILTSYAMAEPPRRGVLPYRGSSPRFEDLVREWFGVYLGLLIPPDFPEGAVPTGFEWYRFVILGALRVLLSLFGIFFLGSILTGAVVSAFPGLNGVLSAAATHLGTFVWYAGGLVPWLFVTPSNPGEAYTRDENVGTLLVVAVAFCAVFPIVVLAGYLGGRLGWRLRGGP